MKSTRVAYNKPPCDTNIFGIVAEESVKSDILYSPFSIDVKNWVLKTGGKKLRTSKKNAYSIARFLAKLFKDQ